MDLTTDDLIAMGAALEAAFNLTDIELAARVTGTRNADAVRRMREHWLQLRSRIMGALADGSDNPYNEEG
jgi:hypothetical protein